MKYSVVKTEVYKAYDWLKKEIIEPKSQQISNLKTGEYFNYCDIKKVKYLFDDFEWLLINHIYNIVYLAQIMFNKQHNKREHIICGVYGFACGIYDTIHTPYQGFEDELVDKIYELLKINKFRYSNNYCFNVRLENYHWNGNITNIKVKL